MFATRRGWPKRSSNRIGERTMVLVPRENSEEPSRAAHDAERKGGAVLANGTEERAIARAAIDALSEQLAIANRRLDEATACSARAMERAASEIADVRRQLSDAQAAERLARDEAAGLRTRLDQLQGRGLWARLRNKR